MGIFQNGIELLYFFVQRISSSEMFTFLFRPQIIAEMVFITVGVQIQEFPVIGRKALHILFRPGIQGGIPFQDIRMGGFLIFRFFLCRKNSAV